MSSENDGSPDGSVNGWEPVIGLEIHVQLKTRTKMFCRCENIWGDPENTHTCPVCLAHPGALPVPNRTAIEWTIKLGLALGCVIAAWAMFSRKNYFYPDLPKGYQISQYDEPLCLGGRFIVPGVDSDHEIGIVRAHLEEDAAKTIHVGGEAGRIAGAEHSLVDFNRGGTPLVEIVTEPDLRSADESKRFLELLRQTVVELGISDAEMEKGSLRCDANISVRKMGEERLRTKTELKNMNSFSFVAKGIEAEVDRQIALYQSGEEVIQETLHFDPRSGELSSLRAKEEAMDYRYFPEPDLMPVSPASDVVDRLRGELPELPGARIRRLEQDVDHYRATVLVTGGLDELYEDVVAAGVDADSAANVLTNQFVATGITPGAVSARELAKLINARDDIPRGTFDEALAATGAADFVADRYLSERAISDASDLDPVLDQILAEHEGEVEQYRAGKEGLLKLFVGQVMKETQGKANPKVVSELLQEKLRS